MVDLGFYQTKEGVGRSGQKTDKISDKISDFDLSLFIYQEYQITSRLRILGGKLKECYRIPHGFQLVSKSVSVRVCV